MSLRYKTLILIILIFGVSLSTIFVYQLIAFKQKQHFYKENSKNQQLIINYSIKTRSDKFIEISKDMSAWDEMVCFILNPDSNWFKKNFVPPILNYKINSSLIYDKNLDLITMVSDSLHNFPINSIDKTKLEIAFSNNPFCHFFQYSGTELYEIYGATVVSSSDFHKRESSPQGYLINVIQWDSIYQENLSIATGFKVKLLNISKNQKIAEPIDGEFFLFQHQLNDYQNNPVSIIEFNKINDSSLVIETFNRFGLYMSLIAIISLVIAFIFLTKQIFAPLSLISKALNDNSEKPLEPLLNKSGDFKKLVELMIQFFRNRETLQNSNTALNMAIEQSPATIVITNPDGNIEYVNPAFTKVSGFSKEEAVGKNPRILKSDQTPAETYKKLWETINSGKVWTGELINKTKTGDLYFEEAIIAPVLAADGKIGHYIAIKTDISHRKKMEEIIYLNNRRMQLLLSLSMMKDASNELMLDKALEFSIELTNSQIGYIYFYEESSKKFTLHAWSDHVMTECAIIEKKTKYELDSTGIWGEVVRQRKPIMVNEFEKENNLKRGYPAGHVPLTRFLSIPVFSDNEIVAVIGVGNKQEPYDEMDIVQLNLLAESIWAISRQNEDQKKLAKYAKDLKQSNDEFLSQTEELNQLLEMLSSTNDKLTESEEKLKTLINTIPDLIWLKDKNGVYLQANQRFEDFVGSKEHDIIGKTDYDFVDKELASFFRENDLRAIDAGKPTINEELVTFVSDGHQEYLETIKTPIYGLDQNLIGVLGVGRDITKRKQDEFAIKESEELLKEAQKIGNVGHWNYNIPEDKLKWSEQVYKIYEIDPETFNCTFDNVVANFYPDDRQRVIDTFYESVKNKTIFEITHRIYTPSGKLKYVSERAETKYDANGNPVSNTGSVLDITEIKTIELELKKNEALFHAVFDASPAGISIINQDGTTLFTNKAYESINGYSHDETIGNQYTNHIYQEDYEFVTQKVKELFSGQEKIVAGEIRMIHKNGKIVWVRSSASIFPIEFDNKKAMITNNQDITHQKMVENQLIELNATKDKLFTIIGHDLRGPIASFKSMIEMLITEFDLTDTEALTRILELVAASAGNSYDLLDNLLNWAKSQRNEISFVPKQIGFFEIVKSSISVLNETANKKSITIHNSIPENQKIYADKDMLTTVVRNLISNAIKFTETNKNIYLSISEVDQYYRISIKDEGIGITTDEIPKIFNTLGNYTTYGTGGEKGSGLGLLLCMDFVKRHGGKIWVESQPGIGSDFIFILPFGKDQN